jgi:hypothetical protein
MSFDRKVRIAIVALTPALFWAGVTTVDVLRHDPEALEDPIASLLAVYFFWGPVFAATSIVFVLLRNRVPASWTRAWWIRALMGAAVALPCLVAGNAYGLPFSPWLLCIGLGALIGVLLGGVH